MTGFLRFFAVPVRGSCILKPSGTGPVRGPSKKGNRTETGPDFKALRITGPNDATRVVWALGKFFLLFLYYWLLYIGYIYYIKDTERPEEVDDHKKGPLVSFFFSICVFHILNYIYSYYWSYNGMEGPMEGYDDENGPKRLVWAIGKFFFRFFFVFFNTNGYFIVYIGSTLRNMRRRDRCRE